MGWGVGLGVKGGICGAKEQKEEVGSWETFAGASCPDSPVMNLHLPSSR